MKMNRLYILSLFVSLAGTSLSQQVTSQEAIRAAINIMRNETQGDMNIQMQSFDCSYGENGEVLLYEVFLNNGTSVLLSGNRNCTPLLAINYDSETSILDTVNDCPIGVKDLLYRYSYQIKQQYLSKSFCEENQEEWNKLQYYDTSVNRATRAPVYGPLTTTKWGQGSPYNYFVQSECNSGGKCLLGCTAVAMGQIMKYWNYPIITYDFSNQFDWCNMPNSISASSTSTEIEAVSWLLYQCAESIDMTYCVDNDCQSLGWPSDVPDALRSWGYVDSIRLDDRGLTSYTTWSKMIVKELEAGRPVLYAGLAAFISIYGHSFVCDGYNANNKLFHFNWGWSGNHNDEWFKIDSLHPGAHNYSHQERIVRFISPANTQNYCNSQMSLNDFYHQYYYTHIIGYNNNTPSSFLNPPPYQITPKTLTILESAPSTSRWEFRTIPTDVTATYQAHEEVHLRDGFTVERGADFTARIVPCPNCENRETESPETTETPDNAAPLETASGHPLPATDYQPTATDLYPNPTDGEVTVGVDGEVQSIIIYNIMGRPVGGWNIRSLASDQIVLDVSPLPAGTYILHVQTPMGTSAKRLVVTR